MSEKLRDHIPAGDPRNKIEWLADQVEEASTEIYQQIEELAESASGEGGAPAVNLLNNGSFENMDCAQIRYDQRRWFQHTMFSATRDINDVALGNSNNVIFDATAWAAESLTHDTGLFYAWSEYIATNFDANDGYRSNTELLFFNYAETAPNAEFALYQVFRAPLRHRDFIDNNPSVIPRYSIHVCGFKANVYLVELDVETRAASVIAQGELDDPYAMNRVPQLFIHDIELKAGALYAFVAATSTVGGSSRTAYTINHAAIYRDDNGEAIPPAQVTASNAPLSSLNSMFELGTFNEAQINGGLTLPLPMRDCPFGAERHFTVGVIRDDAPDSVPHTGRISAHITGHEVSITASESFDETVRIVAHYSDTPTNINLAPVLN